MPRVWPVDYCKWGEHLLPGRQRIARHWVQQFQTISALMQVIVREGGRLEGE